LKDLSDQSRSLQNLSFCVVSNTQVEDSDRQKQADLARNGGENQSIRQESSENQWNSKAVFRTGMFLDFSGDFRPFLTENHRKNPKTFRPQYCFQVPSLSY
jgi:hypothetical protein